MKIVRSLQLYGSVLKLSLWKLRKSPFLFRPFFYLLLIELLALLLIYFSPQWPLRTMLEKPIRAFFGEPALHYPFNLAVLPLIFRRVQVFINIVLGSLFTGVAISLVNQKEKQMSHRFTLNLRIAFHRYFPLLAYGIVIFILIFLFEHYSSEFVRDRLIRHHGYFLTIGQVKWNFILIACNILFTVLLEVFFLYVPVLIIVENWGFWKSARNSLLIARKYFLTTLLIVSVPLLFYVSIVILKLYIPRLMSLFFPEISLSVVALGIIAAFFLNTFIAVTSTLLYLSICAHRPR